MFDRNCRLRRGALCLTIIMSGLMLRRFGMGIGLPMSVVKYGGSLLWGAMVFFVVAVILHSGRRRTIVLTAVVVAIVVELFRLYHTPSLDAFRLTLLGALLLGRVFSAWNLVAYGAGILLGLATDVMFERQLIRRGGPGGALKAGPRETAPKGASSALARESVQRNQ
jgi:hypothetical protein